MLMKLGLDFFQDIRIKKLRKMEHGDTLVCIYLKLLGLQAENDGFLDHKSKEIFVKELSLATDEDENHMLALVNFLQENDLLEIFDDLSTCFISLISVKIISQSSTERVRKHRKRKVLQSNPKEKNTQSCNSSVTACNDSVTPCNSSVTACNDSVTPCNSSVTACKKKDSTPSVVEVFYEKELEEKK